jgi:SH3-like domain-containing protein
MRHISIRIVIKTIIALIAVSFIIPSAGFAKDSAKGRMSVKGDIANMRSGPGTKNDVLWQVEKYHPFKIVEKKDVWYRVKDFENDEAWLHESLLGKTATVITTKDKCNVRAKSDTKAQVLFTVEKGVPFKVLAKNGNWLKVEHADGDIGWIYKTLVW